MFVRGIPMLFFSICFFFLLTSCKRKHQPEIAFYHWKTAPQTDDASIPGNRKTLQHFNTHRLFVKVMDIDWDETYGVYPSTSFALTRLKGSLGSQLPDLLNVTPVVFITTRALEKTDSNTIDKLAANIVAKTIQLVQGRKTMISGEERIVYDTGIRITELQLDCDWTGKTQKKYFALLAAIKKFFPETKITATLRLHQYKYPERTGVPPVDELCLMCYNTGEVKNAAENNSIFNYAKAKEYFTNTKPYPKKLNFALPAFDWVAIFKQGRFYKIDNNIPEQIFSDTALMKEDLHHAYVLQRDTVLNNNFLRRGDVFRWERVNDEAMQQAAMLCTKAVNSQTFKVVFYDIDHINSTNYASVQKALGRFIF